MCALYLMVGVRHLNGGSFYAQIITENFRRVVATIDEQFVVGTIRTAQTSARTRTNLIINVRIYIIGLTAAE